MPLPQKLEHLHQPPYPPPALPVLLVNRKGKTPVPATSLYHREEPLTICGPSPSSNYQPSTTRGKALPLATAIDSGTWSPFTLSCSTGMLGEDSHSDGTLCASPAEAACGSSSWTGRAVSFLIDCQLSSISADLGHFCFVFSWAITTSHLLNCLVGWWTPLILLKIHVKSV